jgi:hypothetical protein
MRRIHVVGTSGSGKPMPSPPTRGSSTATVDLPRATVMAQVTRRTFRRWWRAEQL